MQKRSSPGSLDSEYMKLDAPAGQPALVGGKYRLVATLGRGGMADVFLGIASGPSGFNKLVVIKKLRENKADNPNFVSMFLDEARLTARLNHPNVVHTYEFGEQHDGYFLAMEYIEGKSLKRIVAAHEGKPVDFAFAGHIVSEALLGLHHAHELRDYDGSELGIVHRDFSPHNILVTYEGQIKVLDFGIAKAAMNESETQVGTMKGKFAYMAPEQATGAPVDRRTDVFVAGIVLWELLTGERLFKGDSVQVLINLVSRAIVAPSAVNPAVPAELDAIIAKALQRDPKDRYATAYDMSEAISDCLARTSRPLRREEITARMSELFGNAREQRRREINEYVEAGKGLNLTDPLATTGGHAIAPRGMFDAARATSPSLVGLPIVTPAPPSSGGQMFTRKNAAIAAAAGVVCVGALLLGMSRSRGTALPLPATNGGLVANAGAAPAMQPGTGSAPMNQQGASTLPSSASEPESFHLTLSSDPLEASVEWAGKPIGQTPMMIDLPPGPQSFVVSKDGYYVATVVVSVSEAMAGRTGPRTIVLVPKKTSPSSTGEHASAAAAPAATHEHAAAPVAARATPTASSPTSRGLSSADAPAATATARAEAVAMATATAAAPDPTVEAPRALALAAPATATAAPSAAAPPVVAAALPFGPEMTRPTLLSGSDPEYPREARIAGVEGTIIAKCTITASGSLQGCRIVKGLPFMDKPMLDALATRKYTPVSFQGRAVAVEYVFSTRIRKP